MKTTLVHTLGATLLWLTAMSAGGVAPAVTATLNPSSPVRVALLLDQPPGDHGPTDNLLHGLEKAKNELGIVGDVIIVSPTKRGDTGKDRAGQDADVDALEQSFKRAASDYDLIVLGSPALHELLMNHAGNFRRARFLAVDGAVKAPNIASITFADTQAAFLAGAAAATLTTHTAIPGINTERILGWVGDFDRPSRRAEAEAFLQGARLVHPETRVMTLFTEDTREEAGYRAAKELYAKGVDIIAHHAGHAGLGVLRAAHEQQRHALGHTRDQSAIKEIGSAVLFSQLHHSDAAVFDSIKAAVEGRFPGGTEEERGLIDTKIENSPENRSVSDTSGVGLSNLEPLRQKLGTAFPADLPQRLRELEFEIQRGGIHLPKVQKKSLCDCL